MKKKSYERSMGRQRFKQERATWHMENQQGLTLCHHRLVEHMTRNPEAVTCKTCLAIMRGQGEKKKDSPWSWGDWR